MTAFNSAGSGVWHNVAQWGGANYPGDTPAQTDTATILSTHSITLGTTTEAGQIGAVTINKSGYLVVDCVRTKSFNGLLLALSGSTISFTYSKDTKLIMANNLSCTGTLYMGDTTNPISAANSCVLEFSCASDGQYGLVINNNTGTLIGQGATKTVWDYSAMTNSISSTVLSTNTSTGWKDNDVIGVSPTARTATQKEYGTLNGNASGTTLTVDGFLGTGGIMEYVHSGVSPTKAEIINLTRNCRITSDSASNMTYMTVGSNCTVNCDYVEFYRIGYNGSPKYGITLNTVSGSVNLAYCSWHGGEYGGVVTASATNCDNITIDHCVGYLTNSSAMHVYYSYYTGTYTNNVITNNVFIGASYGIYGYFSGTITGNIISGCANAYYVAQNNSSVITVSGTFNNNTAHSVSQNGFYFGTVLDMLGATISNLTAYRCTNYGIVLTQTYNGIFDTISLTGCGNDISFAGACSNLGFYSMTTNGEASYATVINFVLASNNSGLLSDIVFYNSTFGATTAATTSGFLIQDSGAFYQMGNTDILFKNCSIGASTKMSSGTQNNISILGAIKLEDFGSTGAHTTYKRNGTITLDTSFYNTASPSVRMTPRVSSRKLDNYWACVAKSGQTVTVTAQFRKSQTAGGPPAETAYNGNQPTLKLSGRGIAEQTDTMTVAVGNWEELSVGGAATSDGVVNVWASCDGTAGWLNVDDFTVTYT